MKKSVVRKIDTLLILAGVAFVILLLVFTARPWKPVLTVWSCGSNYESISDYCKEFGKAHNCCVRYVAAPVQYLLELAMDSKNPPDVIVGRAGPGWQALKQAGLLERGPVFFAMDPYVIVTAPDNPKKIRDLTDLGRNDVTVAISPHAMRPRGKCPAHMMSCVSDAFHPGLCERWENNCISDEECGRSLADPVADGRADAAIVPRCMTSWKSLQDKIDVVPINLKYMLAMKQCKATVPQCCGILTKSKKKELAGKFVDELLSAEGAIILAKHGYLPIDSPEANELKDLIQVFAPQDLAGWQMNMGLGLFGDAAYGAALRQFLSVIHIHGPNRYDAQARYWAGMCLEAMGNNESARQQWLRVTKEFPRKSRNEWESEVLYVGKPVPDVEVTPESYWVTKSRNALKRVQSESRVFSDQHYLMKLLFKMTHEPVVESDPDNNGTRNLQLAKDLLEVGRYEDAARDFAKVLTLNYPSKHSREAQFWLGLTASLREINDVAASEWMELTLGSDKWAIYARKALSVVDKESPQLAFSASSMPARRPSYDTLAERGMTYGMLLWKHRLPQACFMEMNKILFGEYQKPGKLAPEARYRMGVCCKAMNKPQAAFNQWELVQICYPDAQKWTQMAKAAQLKIPVDKSALLPFVAQLQNKEEIMAFKEIPKSPFAKRFKGANELFNAGLTDGEQCLLEYWKVMTVTDPSQEKNRKLRPMAEYRAGLCSLKAGMTKSAKKHFENVIDKYPEDKAAKMADDALRTVGE